MTRPLVAPHLQNLIAYVPGKPIEETEREYGVSGIAKLASNENCLGPSPKAAAAAAAALSSMHLYPDAGAFYFKQRLVEHHRAAGIDAAQLVVGNGTNEILTLLVRALVGPDEAVMVGWPSFIVYRLAAMGLNRREYPVALRPDHTYDLEAMAQVARDDNNRVKLIFVANPNNPTGQYIGRADLEAFLDAVPADVTVVLDEAYAEYVDADDYPDGMALCMRRPRTVVTRTFSKVFGLAALRVGYAVCDPEIADVLNRLRDPFNTNSVAQVAAMAALDDTDHVAKSVAHNSQERARLAAALEGLGIDVTPSQCNFLLGTWPEGAPPTADINEQLLRRAVIVRPMAGYGLAQSARITVGTADENNRLIAALREVLPS